MSGGVTDLAIAIGRRVRAHRQERGWTLDDLAHAAGVSRRALVNVEQGTANPSVSTLLRLAEALGVGLPTLVEAPLAHPVRVTSNGSGAVLWSSQAGGRGVMVADTATPDVVELWEWTLNPGDEHSSPAHRRGTRELLHVLDGVLHLTVADEGFTLNRGDSASFPGDVPHSYANTAPEPVRFILTVVEPVGGARPDYRAVEETPANAPAMEWPN